MSEETATIDPKDVRTQLGLAADAPDADVIVELLKLIAQLTAQIETLTGQAAQSEKELANRILERYADRIPAGTEPFWAEQILTNREAALVVLEKLPVAASPPVSRRLLPARSSQFRITRRSPSASGHSRQRRPGSCPYSSTVQPPCVCGRHGRQRANADRLAEHPAATLHFLAAAPGGRFDAGGSLLASRRWRLS